MIIVENMEIHIKLKNLKGSGVNLRPVFVLIRGNSGTGKTTLAKKLQAHFGCQQCLLLQQDILRREVLHADDHEGTLAVDMIEILAEFGFKHYSIIILEGILRKDVYGKMLEKLCREFRGKTLIYYLDLPFDLTVRLNRQKDHPFTSTQLREWWLDKDYLTKDDCKLTSVLTTFEEIVKNIET